ncbi:MAG: ATP-binding protein [bacterium]|nr:ATP-binding protein [bacterium]
MEFYDREDELAALNKINRLSTEGSHLTIVIGRRRVGKTELIKEFLKNQVDKNIYFFVYRKEPKLLLEEFVQIWNKEIGFLPQLSNFTDFFRLLFQYAEKEKIIIVFDEFQNFQYVDPSIFSILQHLWDEWNKKTRMNLVIIGSLVSMIQKIFTDKKEPLFGRATNQLSIAPLRFEVIRRIFNDYGETRLERVIEFYSLFGGIPKYYFLMHKGNLFKKDAGRVLKELLFSREALLKNEIPMILMEEFGGKYQLYLSILEAIALGKSKMSEIASAVGIKVNSLPKYLNTLAGEHQIIERKVPVTEKRPWKSKQGLYFIKDNFTRFWFAFVYRHSAYFEIENFDFLLDFVKQNLPGFTGFAFEDIVKQILLKVQEKEFFRFEKIGSWWNRQEEIDLIGLNEAEKKILFVECKWRSQPVDKKILSELKRRSSLIAWHKEKWVEYFLVVSKSGFTQGAKKMAEKEGILLWDRQDLEAGFT